MVTSCVLWWLLLLLLPLLLLLLLLVDMATSLDGWMDALLHSFWAGLAIEGRYGDLECACLTLQPSRPKFHAASTPARNHSPNTCIAPLSVRDFRRVSQ